MNKTDEEIRSDLERMENFHVDMAIEHLTQHEKDFQAYLYDFAISLCGVSKSDMRLNSNSGHIAHARWFFWYAYRYMTNETYKKIANITKDLVGKTYSSVCINDGANRMSMMIETEPLWKKRWVIISRIIKMKNEAENKTEDNTIVICVPKDLKDKISITVKDK